VQRIGFLRSTFGSSRLVRLIGPWAPVEAHAPGMDFAERLSLWLNAFDAIGLQAAQQSIRAIEAQPQPARAARTPDLAEDLRRVRSVLEKAIAQKVDTSEPGYAPWQQRHAELQRQMDLMISPLRDHVRQAISRVSPRLRQLAVLDAAMEKLLAARTETLLPALPGLLKRRFEQLHDAGEPPDAFTADWRQALQAELDLRLEPVTGLVAALSPEFDKTP
jgi:hypothetical protein